MRHVVDVQRGLSKRHLQCKDLGRTQENKGGWNKSTKSLQSRKSEFLPNKPEKSSCHRYWSWRDTQNDGVQQPTDRAQNRVGDVLGHWLGNTKATFWNTGLSLKLWKGMGWWDFYTRKQRETPTSAATDRTQEERKDYSGSSPWQPQQWDATEPTWKKRWGEMAVAYTEAGGKCTGKQRLVRRAEKKLKLMLFNMALTHRKISSVCAHDDRWNPIKLLPPPKQKVLKELDKEQPPLLSNVCHTKNEKEYQGRNLGRKPPSP